MKFRLLAAAALLASQPAAAQTADNAWINIASDVSGSVWQMRYRDIQNSTNKSPRTWVTVDHSKDRTVTVRETKHFYEFDCDGRRAKLLSRIRYNAGGVVADSHEPSYPSFEFVAPDTVLERALDMACPAGS